MPLFGSDHSSSGSGDLTPTASALLLLLLLPQIVEGCGSSRSSGSRAHHPLMSRQRLVSSGIEWICGLRGGYILPVYLPGKRFPERPVTLNGKADAGECRIAL